MIKLILLLLLTLTFVSTNEDWFIFDQYQLPGFETPLFTLTSSEGRSLSFTLSTYDRSILVNSNNEIIRLSIDRADLLHNTLYHTVFLAIRNGNRLETYVNCKLIDSYLFYTSFFTHENSTFTVKDRHEKIEHYQIKPTGETTQQEIFDIFSCKQINPSSSSSEHPGASTIGRSLVRKMQHVIEKVQQRNLRPRRQNDLETSSALLADSLTIIYKPNMDTNTSSHSIFAIPSLHFYVHYYPTDHLFRIQFQLANRTQYLLYAEKSTDVTFSSNQSRLIFLHLTSAMVSSYVNCELVDQDLITDTVYIETLMGRIIASTREEYQYNPRATVILTNKFIEQVAANFFCTKLDQKHQDLLPDRYTLRKFTNALDILAESLDGSEANRVQNVSTIDLPPINGYGSLKEFTTNPPIVRPTTTTASQSIGIIHSEKSCSTDADCNTTKSALKCQSGQCACPQSFFWSTTFHRCVECHDISIGDRCFRLSTHKSTWYEANDYCQDEEGEEYSMKFVSNLNHTDIQYLKAKYLHSDENEHVDYIYWIGATSHFNTRKLHGLTSRRKREIPTQIFRWFDTGETAQINLHDLWCSQSDYASLSTINNNQLCVGLTSCGLYADDCQSNYRFLCQAV